MFGLRFPQDPQLEIILSETGFQQIPGSAASGDFSCRPGKRAGGKDGKAGRLRAEVPGQRRKDRSGDGRKPGDDDRKAEEGEMEEDGNDKRTDGDRRKTERRRQKGRDG